MIIDTTFLEVTTPQLTHFKPLDQFDYRVGYIRVLVELFRLFQFFKDTY